MQWLSQICVNRPVFTWVLSLAALVVGLSSVVSLPVDRFPDIDVPIVSVITAYPGASPQQVETEVSEVLEEAVNSVSGLSELRSTSSQGLSLLLVQFDLEKDADVATQEIRDKLQTAQPLLPTGIEMPQVIKMDPDAAPIIYAALRGPGTPQELTQFADDEVKQRLEGKPGVGSVQIVGGREREIRVEVDPARLAAQGLTVLDVRTALQRENLERPGGDITMGGNTMQVRIPGRLSKAGDFAAIPVTQVGGRTVRLRDVANVEDAAAEVDSIAKYDGAPVVLLSVMRQSGTNAVAVADGLRAEVDRIGELLPAGYQLDIVRDESTFIRNAIAAVEEHLALGALCAALVVLLFLRNFRSTIIASLAIPVSIVATFAVIQAMDLTLNVLTLLALTLAVGIVIDDAIVVLENIMRFVEERKQHPREAALKATKDIGLAVMATTLSLVAVFLPVVFMGGIVGRFLSSFGATMTAAILVSLVVAFSMTPMLAARWLRQKAGHTQRPEPGEASPLIRSRKEEQARFASWRRGSTNIELHDGFLERAYTKLLALCMQHRWIVALAIMASMGSLALILPVLPSGFLPDDDESRFEVLVKAPQGTSLQHTEIIIERLARALRKVDGIDHTVSMVGSEDNDIASRGDNEATIYISMSEPDERALSQIAMQEYVQNEVIPPFIEEYGLDIDISKVAAMGGSGAQAAPIQYILRGPDLAKLKQYSDHLSTVLGQQPGVSKADTTLEEGQPELRVEINRPRAAELGVSVSAIADTVATLVGGMDVSEFEVDGEQFDVRVQAIESARRRATDLDQYEVRTSTGQLVPLSQVARLVEGTSPASIERVGRQRAVNVYATLLPGASTAKILQTLDQEAKALNMGADYGTVLSGQAKEFGRAAQAFGTAIFLSFAFMYLIIAAQFESWIHPITILVALPLTVPFALLSLLIFGQSLNVFSMLGLLVLFGIVKKNSILQVDHTLTLRREGWSRADAIMLANRDRLRPILMTTIAFVAGMIPLMLSRGAGQGTNRAIASIVIGGQSLALLLTLVATPVVYSWLDDLTNFRARQVARLRSHFSSGSMNMDHPVSEVEAE